MNQVWLSDVFTRLFVELGQNVNKSYKMIFMKCIYCHYLNTFKQKYSCIFGIIMLKAHFGLFRFILEPHSKTSIKQQLKILNHTLRWVKKLVVAERYPDNDFIPGQWVHSAVTLSPLILSILKNLPLKIEGKHLSCMAIWNMC